MALKVRHDVMPYGTDVVSTEITRASRLVSAVTGFQVQPNKAIVGANAFAHESGIHQDGMLKDASTYEIMTPESVGLAESSLVMGKHSRPRTPFARSSRSSATASATTSSRTRSSASRTSPTRRSMSTTRTSSRSSTTRSMRENDTIRFGELEVYCGSHGPQRAILTLEVDGVEAEAMTRGNGPVDAVFNAMRKLVPHDDANVVLYEVHAVTEGADAQATVSVVLSEDGRLVRGTGSHVDTLVASAKAYVNALNKLIVKRGRSELPSLAKSTA